MLLWGEQTSCGLPICIPAACSLGLRWLREPVAILWTGDEAVTGRGRCLGVRARSPMQWVTWGGMAVRPTDVLVAWQENYTRE